MDKIKTEERSKKKIMRVYNALIKDCVLYSEKEISEEYPDLNKKELKIIHELLRSNLKKKSSKKKPFLEEE